MTFDALSIFLFLMTPTENLLAARKYFAEPSPVLWLVKNYRLLLPYLNLKVTLSSENFTLKKLKAK